MAQYFLIAVIIIQAVLYHFDRRDMLNRLMSKNLSDYTQAKSPPPKHIPSAHEKTLNRWRSTKVGE